MAIVTSGEWVAYHTRKKSFVCGVECGTGKLILTNEPGEVRYFKTKEYAEMAMELAKCGKCYKAVRVKLVIKEDNEK